MRWYYGSGHRPAAAASSSCVSPVGADSIPHSHKPISVSPVRLWPPYVYRSRREWTVDVRSKYCERSRRGKTNSLERLGETTILAVHSFSFHSDAGVRRVARQLANRQALANRREPSRDERARDSVAVDGAKFPLFWSILQGLLSLEGVNRLSKQKLKSSVKNSNAALAALLVTQAALLLA